MSQTKRNIKINNDSSSFSINKNSTKSILTLNNNNTVSHNKSIKYSQIFEEVSKASVINSTKNNFMTKTKSIDKTKMYKNLYTIDTGKTILTIKNHNKLLSTNTE